MPERLLRPGDRAPDVPVVALDGRPTSLLALRAAPRTAFVFLRHFG